MQNKQPNALAIGGERISGANVRDQNGNCFIVSKVSLVIAAASIANIVKSSLGPVGLDKMLVDDIGVLSCVCLYIGCHYFKRWCYHSQALGSSTSRWQSSCRISPTTRQRSG